MGEHKKPTGMIGVAHKIMTPESAPRAEFSHFEKLEFPDTKDEIEEFIVRAYLRNSPMDKLPCSSCKPIRLAESDLDFRLDCPDGQLRKMELMEASLLEHLQCTYETAPAQHNAYEYAEFIYGKVMVKSRKYGSVDDTKHYLLLYITERRFMVAGPVLKLLQHWTSETEHNFESIYLFMPIDERRGAAYQVFPDSERKFDNFDPESLRDKIVYHLTIG